MDGYRRASRDWFRQLDDAAFAVSADAPRDTEPDKFQRWSY
jgi:hypothetical protein